MLFLEVLGTTKHHQGFSTTEPTYPEFTLLPFSAKTFPFPLKTCLTFKHASGSLSRAIKHMFKQLNKSRWTKTSILEFSGTILHISTCIILFLHQVHTWTLGSTQTKYPDHQIIKFRRDLGKSPSSRTPGYYTFPNFLLLLIHLYINCNTPQSLSR